MGLSNFPGQITDDNAFAANSVGLIPVLNVNYFYNGTLWIRGTANTSGHQQVEATFPSGQAQDVHPVDDNGVNLDVAEDVALPAGTRALLIGGEDLGGVVRFPTVSVDSVDAKRRLEMQGKVSINASEPPPASTPVQYRGDTPLNVTSDETDDYLIANGVTLTLTSVVAGAEGDPNERGSKVEIYYVAATVEHIVGRYYLSGFSTQFFPDTDTTRDGTTMTGNGTDTYLRIFRERLGGSGAEIDVVVRGFTQ